MQTIIGLGEAGCNIADHLSQYPQYHILKIDAELKKTKTTFGLKRQTSPEHHEKRMPRGLEKFLEGVMPETLLITSCGTVSGASLRILEKIKSRSQISLMYVCPERENLPDTQRLQNNLLFNVFQEYARSGLFARTFLVDNKQISGIIGPVPILKYWDNINHMIASTYHMINVFQHQDPVFTTFTSRVPTARISTLGISTFSTEEEIAEKCFFKLDIPREKRYYYAVPQKMLEEDVTLMEKIQKGVKNAIEHDKMKIGYSIYSTEYDDPYVYCENSSTLIQQLAF